MARTLEQTVVDPTYLEFFGLSQPPFARLADPSQLFHSEQYSILMEHLANAATNSDSLVVVCGADGSGKTTLLNRFVASVGDQISCVAINEACQSEEQFYSAFLTQIGFAEITGTASELQNITKEFLVCRGFVGDHIMMIIDNAHLTDPTVLKQIRRLCEIKIKDRRVLSVVLAGNADIVRVVDAPAMRQIKFQNHVVFGIRNYSEEETASYVSHRLRSAGDESGLKFSNEVSLLIHRYSGGTPHLINALCNEMLAVACSFETREITEEFVRTAANKQQLLPHVIPLHGKGRRTTDPDPDPQHLLDTPDVASVDADILLQQIARLSAQIGDLQADKKRALQDIDARNNDVLVLRDELKSQSVEVEKLTLSLANDANEITQQNIALTDNAAALQDSEDRSKRLAADLENETLARLTAQNEVADATATVEELTNLKRELQTTVDDVRADLELRLEESQARFESAQQHIAALKNPGELEKIEEASDKLAADLRQESRARKAAQKELAKATETAAELSSLKHELQATVDDVRSDLKVGLKAADQRAVEIELLERETADLKDEIEGKSGEIDSLRDELASRNRDVADLENCLEESKKERTSSQLRFAALQSPEELEEVRRLSSKLATELEQEIAAREAVDRELEKSTAKVEELNQLKQELQGTVRDLNADLTVAGERTINSYVLERKVTDLKDVVEEITHELDSRNQALTDLEGQLEASQNESEVLRSRDSAVSADEDSIAEESVTASTGDARVYSSSVVRKFEQSIRDVPAFKALRKYDPGSYDHLISTYQKLVGQGLTDKQISDALRSEQVELVEKLIPRASDDAIITYGRLIVDQLDELQLDGIEPCLTLMVPQANPDRDTSPIFSERTKERELDTLHMTLRTYNAQRKLPTEEDVWPDLGPVFSELFDAFGSENVAALENSYDPNIDRILVCNVSRALYSGILNFPKRKAVNALRWLLST